MKSIAFIGLGNMGLPMVVNLIKAGYRVHAADVRREAVEAAGVHMLDAPVSGGVPGAVAGTLTIMVGGDAAVVSQARPILGVMGKNVVHVGPLGSGEVAKICNNLLAGVSMIAAAEAFTIGTRAGVDPKILHDVIRTSSGN